MLRRSYLNLEGKSHGNSAEYDCHIEFTEDSCGKSVTYISDPVGMTTRQIALLALCRVRCGRERLNMGVAETRQGLLLMRPSHLHGWLGDEQYSNRRRGHLGHCWPPE